MPARARNLALCCSALAAPELCACCTRPTCDLELCKLAAQATQTREASRISKQVQTQASKHHALTIACSRTHTWTRMRLERRAGTRAQENTEVRLSKPSRPWQSTRVWIGASLYCKTARSQTEKHDLHLRASERRDLTLAVFVHSAGPARRAQPQCRPCRYMATSSARTSSRLCIS